MQAGHRRVYAALALLPSLAIIAGLVSCGGDSQNEPLPTKHTLFETLSPKSQAQEQLAVVNGVPIYSDCVVRQATASGISAKEALGECIDFELLSQESKNYLELPEVQERGKQEMVRRFITESYTLTSADDVPIEAVNKLWSKAPIRRRYQHPELRNIVFCRVADSPDKSPFLSKDTAQTYLQNIYEKLKDRSDLKQNDLFGECYPHYKEAGIEKLVLHTFKLLPREQYQKDFREPVFGGNAAVGRVIPPMHTRFGWDLILITDVRESLNISFAEAEPELREALFSNSIYESWRDSLFRDWVAPFEKDRQIQRFPERIPATKIAPGA